MQKPELSVVVVTYNRPQLLLRVLRSLADQDLAGLEVVVTDDGSDPRPDVAGLATQYIWCEDTGYARGEALNRGVRAALGRHVLLMDDDCIPRSRGFCRAHLDALQQARVCSGQTWIWPVVDDGHPGGEPVLVDGAWFTTANLSLSRELFMDIGGFDPLFTGEYGDEDVDLGFRLEDAGIGVVRGDAGTAVDHVGRFFPEALRSRTNRDKLVRKWPHRFPELQWYRRFYHGIVRRWHWFFGPRE